MPLFYPCPSLPFRRRVLACLCLSASAVFPLVAQVRLNEAVVSNRTFADEDGDTPDWIELHNAGPDAADLSGWSLTDRRDQPRKWSFGATTLPPQSYTVAWASGKGRAPLPGQELLIGRGDTARYLALAEPLRQEWYAPDFDDSAWASGPTAIGFGDDGLATAVEAGTPVVLLRQRFAVADPAAVRELLLHVDYDDGFVAYLNGREVARANLPDGRPGFNTRARVATEAVLPQGESPPVYAVPDFAQRLRAGTNVLAVAVHDIGSDRAGASDLSVTPWLVAGYATPRPEARAPDAALAPQHTRLHTSFRLSSGGETVYLFDGDARLVDSLPLYGLPAFGSAGRSPGDRAFAYYDHPTPGAPNGPGGYRERVAGAVTFGRAGGYVQPFALELAGAAPGQVIRYTLDGSVPTDASPVYAAPIAIDAPTAVRARIFGPAGETGLRPSDPQTEVYLVGADHALDVVTFTTDPANLFDPDDGIYVLGRDYEGPMPFYGANIWDDREIPVHFGYYPRGGGRGVALDAGARIFGGWSRTNAQRSFAVFARGVYGANAIRYPLFPNRDYARFSSVVLRNSGNDWLFTHLRDATLTGLMAGSGLDYADYRPAATYVNGAYWGIYNLREKINEDFLAARHGVDPGAVDLLERDAAVVEGSAEAYHSLLEYVATADLTSDAAFARVAAEVDLDNYATYQAAQIYFDNGDWPGNNIKYWRAPGTKWRWVLYDTDFGAGLFREDAHASNTLSTAMSPDGGEWPNPPWSTLLFRRLLTNEGFRHRFVNRMADEMNTRFVPAHAIALIDRNAERIAPEVARAAERWERGFGWAAQVEVMRAFFRERPGYVRQHLREAFGLPAAHELRVEIADTTEGYARVNSVTIDTSAWSGLYYETVPVRVAAVAKTGFAFSHWRHDATLVDSVLRVDLDTVRIAFASFSSGDEQ